MKRSLAAAVGVPSLVLAAIWTSPTDGAAQWTKNYYCQMSGGADVTHWANGTHGYWPGDCAPHEASPE